MPASLDLKCTLLCNNDCLHCVVQDLRRAKTSGQDCYPSAASLKRELIEQRFRGARSLILTGGEPTLRPDLPELVAYAKKIGYSSVHLQTNGRQCTKSGLAEKLAEAGLSTAAVPLLGASSEIHDRITHRRGSFKEAVDGILALAEAGIYICGRSVLLKHNLHCIEAICTLFVELGANRILLSFPRIDRTMAAYSRYKQLVPSYQYVKFVIQWENIPEVIPVRFEGFPLCALVGVEHFSDDLTWLNNRPLVVKYPGRRAMDCDFPWVGQEIRTLTSSCESCIYTSVCFGSYKVHIDLYGDQQHKPVPAYGPVNMKVFELALTYCNAKPTDASELKWPNRLQL